jgi:hypothetical protein
MTEVLQARGFTGMISGATGEGEPLRGGWVGSSHTPVQRGDEIAAWRTKAGHTGPFAVLDDDSDMNAVRGHFIKTSWFTGLLDSDVDQAIRLLKPSSFCEGLPTEIDMVGPRDLDEMRSTLKAAVKTLQDAPGRQPDHLIVPPDVDRALKGSAS